MVRNPLAQRRWPLGEDVSLAIRHICFEDGINEEGLPLAIRRDAIAERLVIMHHTDDDGSRRGNKFDMARTRVEFVNYLKTSGVFQSGYKQYEEATRHPVVPVTDYFFDKIYDDGATRDCLDAMHKDDLKQSLPKRTVKYAYDGEGLLVPENEIVTANPVIVLESGKIAGVVVFPQGSKAQLIAAWHDRILPSAEGAISQETRKLENTGFNVEAITKSVARLEAPVDEVRSILQRRISYTSDKKEGSREK